MDFFKSKGKIIGAYPGYISKKKINEHLKKGLTGRIIVRNMMYAAPLYLEVEFINGKPLCAKGVSSGENIEGDAAIGVFFNILEHKASNYFFQVMALDEKTVRADCASSRKPRSTEEELIEKLISMKNSLPKPEISVSNRVAESKAVEQSRLETAPFEGTAKTLEFELLDPIDATVVVAKATFEKRVEGILGELVRDLHENYYLSCSLSNGESIRILNKNGRLFATRTSISGDVRVDCKLYRIQ